MKKRIFVLLSLLFLTQFAVCVALPNLDFRMSADTYSLSVGGTATITLEAYLEGSQGWADQLNGLNLWQLDMEVDNTGVIEVVNGSWTFIEPDPVDNSNSGVFEINAAAGGKTGNVHGMYAGIQTWGDSDAAIGDYMPIATFDIQGLAGGSAAYSMGDFSGLGWFGYIKTDSPIGSPSYDDLLGNVSFTQANNVFTVVPEPATLIMLSLMGIVGLRGRNAK